MDNNELDSYEPAAKIIVIGVGGAGSNAVNRMIDENIDSVTFFVANTDKQSLSTSKATNRLVLGPEITCGLGAGGEPSVGKSAALASEDEIRSIVSGANMVFIAAGMGGGTGTGAAPVIANIAKEEGALVVAIVTRPFTFEGKKRIANSVEGLNNLKDAVDAIIVVSNDKLLMVSGTAPVSDAFGEADRVLAQSVKTVTDLILMPGIINLDFADVKNTLKDSGVALIGFGMGQGPNKAQDAANSAINSPLLEASIAGAKRAICSVTCGSNVSLYEAEETVGRIIEASGSEIDIKFGVSINEQLTDTILVSVIASDFSEDFNFSSVPAYTKPIIQPENPSVSNENKEENPDNNSLVGDNNVPQEDKKIEISGVEDPVEASILPSFLLNNNKKGDE